MFRQLNIALHLTAQRHTPVWQKMVTIVDIRYKKQSPMRATARLLAGIICFYLLCSFDTPPNLDER
jgi:hypothetical protein